MKMIANISIDEKELEEKIKKKIIAEIKENFAERIEQESEKILHSKKAEEIMDKIFTETVKSVMYNKIREAISCEFRRFERELFPIIERELYLLDEWHEHTEKEEIIERKSFYAGVLAANVALEKNILDYEKISEIMKEEIAKKTAERICKYETGYKNALARAIFSITKEQNAENNEE